MVCCHVATKFVDQTSFQHCRGVGFISDEQDCQICSHFSYAFLYPYKLFVHLQIGLWVKPILKVIGELSKNSFSTIRVACCKIFPATASTGGTSKWIQPSASHPSMIRVSPGNFSLWESNLGFVFLEKPPSVLRLVWAASLFTIFGSDLSSDFFQGNGPSVSLAISGCYKNNTNCTIFFLKTC